MAKRKRRKQQQPIEPQNVGSIVECQEKDEIQLKGAASKDHKKSKKRKGRSKEPSATTSSVESASLPPRPHREADYGVDRQDQQGPPSLTGPLFPYETEDDDHCETPIDAYRDVSPLLRRCSPNQTDPSTVQLYDPYYCNGAASRHLAQLGFTNMYHKKEDCYTVWESGNPPPCDVLITNPPYSCDHIEQLMRHVTSPHFGQLAWFLLMPTFVHKKPYFLEVTRTLRPFFLVPRKRYRYEPPKDFRAAKKSDVHKRSSPFVSMWYIWGGTPQRNEELIRTFSRLQRQQSQTCDLARSRSALRDLRRKKR